MLLLFYFFCDCCCCRCCVIGVVTFLMKSNTGSFYMPKCDARSEKRSTAPQFIHPTGTQLDKCSLLLTARHTISNHRVNSILSALDFQRVSLPISKYILFVFSVTFFSIFLLNVIIFRVRSFDLLSFVRLFEHLHCVFRAHTYRWQPWTSIHFIVYNLLLVEFFDSGL